ncbi:hypothetical protein RRF57_008592 [Xylaria bambusicola]|uniref:Uncharacterized protein n=1 Tax=Xylaria bambusicola TaxID=326684 RepID=A0AAN7UNB3_9PEZI
MGLGNPVEPELCMIKAISWVSLSRSTWREKDFAPFDSDDEYCGRLGIEIFVKGRSCSTAASVFTVCEESPWTMAPQPVCFKRLTMATGARRKDRHRTV